MSSQFLKSVGLCFVMLALGVPLSAQAQHTHELEKNFCILKVGPYGMHLTGYQPDLSGGTENCGEVPGTGRTVLVLDYIEGELRSLPVEIRIIRDTGSEQDLQAITVLYLPPKIYPAGTVNFEYNFDKPGKFVGLVTVVDKQSLVSRFPFSVGETKIWLPPSYFLIAFAGAAVVVAIIFFVLRGRRNTSDSTAS